MLQTSFAITQYAPLLSSNEAVRANGTSLSDERSSIICTTWSKTGNPLTDDCLSALSKMPRTAARRQFHAGDGGLPIQFTNGKCEVHIFFKRPLPTEPEESSWLDLTISATQLMAGCIKGSTSESRTRGEMKLNEDSKIWIEIRKPYRLGDEPTRNDTLEDVESFPFNGSALLADSK